MGYSRKPLAKGIILYTALLLAILFATPLTQAAYGYYTGNWGYFMAWVGGFATTYTVASGTIAVNQGITLAAAAAKLAAKLTPWGWAVIIGVGIAF